MVDVSGEASGSATDLAFRKAEISPAARARQPHFVIGNGSRSQDGGIESTDRLLAEDELLITLMGDLQTAPPTAAQLHGLTELIDYLRAKTGVIPVQEASRAAAAALPQDVLDLAFNQALADPPPSPARAGAE